MNINNYAEKLKKKTEETTKTVRKKKKWLHRLLPQHALSRFLGACSNRDFILGHLTIKWFYKRYQVDLSDAEHQRLQDYRTFNAFFTRRLKPGCRSIADGQQTIISPVDGQLGQWGDIKQGLLVQAKGIDYRLDQLLADKDQWYRQFCDGSFASFYLSPRHYHRVHMPLAGELQAISYIPGRLFSVNEHAVHNIPDLFTRNERAISIFSTKQGPMAIVMIGAMIIAGIHTQWSGKLAPKTAIDYMSYPGIRLQRGEEMGHFELGSTVVVLFSKPNLPWLSKLQVEQEIKMGEALIEPVINYLQ